MSEWPNAARNRAKTHCPQGHLYDVVRSNGRRSCSICRKAHDRKYQSENHEKVLATRQRWRDANREHVRAYQREQYRKAKAKKERGTEPA